MRKILLVLGLSVLFYCSPKEELHRGASAISYETKLFHLKSDNCQDTTQCAEFKVNYIHFLSLKEDVQKIINSKIATSLTLVNEAKADKSLDEIGTEFINMYDSLHLKFPETVGRWYYNADVKIEALVDTLISLSVNEEYNSGGAHGGAGTYFINVDPKTGSDVTLNDVLKPGYDDILLREGEKMFRKERGLSDTTSFLSQGFEFPEGRFKLTDNYGFSPEGIVFYFNSYEIGAYALGPTRIVLPYDSVRLFLRADVKGNL